MEEIMDTCRAHQQKGIKSVHELRLVLFGHGWLEKSSTGNTLLQQQMFDTRRDVKMCVRRQTSNQNGKRIIVINTPDRWVQYTVQDPGLINDNMAECLCMCQPGPHAFLMVVPLGANKGREWTVEGPLQLLNDHVWKNTIVVFTKPEKLKGISIQDYVTKMKYLGPLLEKCGHRYHLLDTSFYGQESQVEELWEKIDVMIENNKTETGVGISTKVEAFLSELNREEVEKKAKLRQSSRQASRSVLRSLTGKYYPASEHRILIVGPKHAGKSSTANTILGTADFSTAMEMSQSHTGQGEVYEKKVTVVDTPGWHGRYYSQDTPLEIVQQIIESSNTSVPNAVLLVLRCDETFTETDRLKVEEHMSLLDTHVWSKTILMFTYKDKLCSTAIEEHIERWPALQWIVDKCGNRYHVLNNLDKNDQIQVRDLLEKIEELDLFNDHQYLLQCYMHAQESCQNLDKKCKETEIQLNKTKAENEELRKMNEEKDCLTNNLMETVAQKDIVICTYKNKVDEMNANQNITLRSLENVERDNNQLKKYLMEKDQLIAWLSSEKTTAQKSIEVERERVDKKLSETIKMQDEMEMEIMKLQEEKKQLNTENECTKMMLQSVVTEVQKHFKKKYNLQRKMTVDVSTLDMLFRLENEEEGLKNKHPEQNIHLCESEKLMKPRSPLTSSPAWLLAGGAALGAVVGGAFGGSCRMEAGLRLNLCSAAGAAAGTLLGACWKSAGSKTQVLRESRNKDKK
ncbi:GTPase IMAP family member 8-like [Boleophthalmus pectinirostris]|uniref:GTPase IMAP family member 8-like n=1 Tax=Boleophthalmus pectinirostris TaxID=150288 RepID=UPI00242EDDA3|nr:GTPase IMAP family member 8-like [Boleophthalmus pectinirostris]